MGSSAHICGADELATITDLSTSNEGMSCGLGPLVTDWTAGTVDESQQDTFCSCVYSIGFDKFEDLNCRLSDAQAAPIDEMASYCEHSQKPCQWHAPTTSGYQLAADGSVEHVGGVVSQNAYDAEIGVTDDGCDYMLAVVDSGVNEFTCDGSFCAECGQYAGF
eukprot:SAG11_NODE_14148_length_623_cov_0.973282_1_plen_162_part_01